MERIIKSLLENDSYKFSMGQAIYHQFPSYRTTWTFKCRNGDVRFTKAMVQEIRDQVQLYCGLRFTEDELAYLKKIPWIKPDYVDFLRLWRPNWPDFDIRSDPESDCGLFIETNGTWLNTSMYEVPVLAIVNEVYFKMAFPYDDLLRTAKMRTEQKILELTRGRYEIGAFSEFGLRRRLSGENQEHVVWSLSNLPKDGPNKFVGTSNVYLAKEYNLTPTGTQAHEWIMCVGQGNRKHNPAYSNHYAMAAWVKEYGILNGTALTDTIGTDAFLRDFDLTFATLFSGVRHDSGNPQVWGDKIIRHYEGLGIDPKTKTLLFSDSLDLQRAHAIAEYFKGRCKMAFGIGTYLSNDTKPAPLNIVMKVTECNDQPVAKVSDDEGKGMCKDQAYVDYLKRAVKWRLEHDG